MYKIIGADGKEYGPITVDQLRQWIAEGRANLQTKVLPDGATQWVSIAELPEFAGAPPPAPLSGAFAAPISSAAPANADAVNAPAIGLLCAAILGILVQVASLVWRLFFAAAFYTHQTGNPFAAPVFTIAPAIIGLIVGGIIVFGALKMKNLENHGLAMAASILAMIPCVSPCCILGLPIGIWALVVLSKPEVKSAFR
jgi:hypothetical protein